MWTALFLGFAGSLHCLAMCGPIGFALPISRSKNKVLSIINYHLARLFSYGLLGGVIGLIGGGFAIAGVQQSLSIILGILLSLIGLQKLFNIRKWKSQMMTVLLNKIHQKIVFSFHRNRTKSFLLMGMINGFLPCGLVYVALSGALVMGHPLTGALYMFFFGMGTLPMMLSIFLIHARKKKKVNLQIGKLIPIITLLFGVWMLVRGLGLSIPYLSPDTKQLEVRTGTVQGCDPTP